MLIGVKKIYIGIKMTDNIENEDNELEFHDAQDGAREVEYKGEIYGRIWETITWSKEEAAMMEKMLYLDSSRMPQVPAPSQTSTENPHEESQKIAK
jgi:hypothetical protein